MKDDGRVPVQRDIEAVVVDLALVQQEGRCCQPRLDERPRHEDGGAALEAANGLTEMVEVEVQQHELTRAAAPLSAEDVEHHSAVFGEVRELCEVQERVEQPPCRMFPLVVVVMVLAGEEITQLQVPSAKQILMNRLIVSPQQALVGYRNTELHDRVGFQLPFRVKDRPHRHALYQTSCPLCELAVLPLEVLARGDELFAGHEVVFGGPKIVLELVDVCFYAAQPQHIVA